LVLRQYKSIKSNAKGMCIASSKFSTEAAKELRSRREQPLAMLVDNI